MKNLLENKKDQDHAVAIFSSLIEHPGWKLFVQMQEQNIELVTEKILTKKDEDGEELTEKQLDILRESRKLHMAIINTPERIIETYSQADDPKDDDPADPYPDTIEGYEKKPRTHLIEEDEESPDPYES